MFKYISEILNKFTLKQRLVALSLILIAIIIISLGPTYIKTIKPDDKILKQRIHRQDSLIISQNNKIIELNNKIISTQQECTDRVLKREKEIIKEIEQLQLSLTKPKLMKQQKYVENDTTPIRSSPYVIMENNDKTVEILDILKNKITKKPTK